MFREMRRGRQQMSFEKSAQILEEGTSGVLALHGDGGYPYALPISYWWDGGQHIYFHCAKDGHKLDAIARDPKASFCVIGQDIVQPEEYTTRYRSVIAFGTMRVLETPEEIDRAIEGLAKKYAPEASPQRQREYIEKELPALRMLELTIQHMTGKEARELLGS